MTAALDTVGKMLQSALRHHTPLLEQQTIIHHPPQAWLGRTFRQTFNLLVALWQMAPSFQASIYPRYCHIHLRQHFHR